MMSSHSWISNLFLFPTCLDRLIRFLLTNYMAWIPPWKLITRPCIRTQTRLSIMMTHPCSTLCIYIIMTTPLDITQKSNNMKGTINTTSRLLIR
mmetsp:Transcript_74281/g.215244  ORF Transcript_74281/g.215244 Transcript_74281/m.215244 type:complete len:94 (+) Transcript_74281:96-377(+)